MCDVSHCPERKSKTSRRKRLWELPERCYCPLIGVCFEIGELRNMLGRLLDLSTVTSEYDVHAIAVQYCQQRTPVAELLQRELEKRYAITVARFKSAKTAEQLRVFWDEAQASPGVRAALWAAWTHPRCDDEISQHVYKGIHMLQHQLGSVQRQDREYVQKLERENLALANELALAQKRFTEFRDAKNEKMADFQRRLQQCDGEILVLKADKQRLTEEVSYRQWPERLAQELAQTQQRLAESEERLLSQKTRLELLAQELANSAKERKWLEEALACQLRQASLCPGSEDSPGNLSGRCVLCVGGRSGAVEIYRGLVERLGGRFMHHDGGMEESIHRLEAHISSADAVICQSGCVSHNAYWLVKDLCKRSGKPCVFAKKPSLSAFMHGLDRLISQTGESPELSSAGIQIVKMTS